MLIANYHAFNVLKGEIRLVQGRKEEGVCLLYVVTRSTFSAGSQKLTKLTTRKRTEVDCVRVYMYFSN